MVLELFCDIQNIHLQMKHNGKFIIGIGGICFKRFHSHLQEFSHVFCVTTCDFDVRQLLVELRIERRNYEDEKKLHDRHK